MDKKLLSYIALIIVISISIISQNLSAQVTQQWARKYNGPGTNKGDIGTAVATDAQGNIYVTGQVAGYGADYDCATIKYNPSGVQQWLTKFHGPLDTSNNYTDAIAVDAAGNVYVTGFSTGITSYADFVTIKYNSSGVQQWVAIYNGPANSGDYGRAIAVDGSGNVYVTGESYGTLYDFATIKYNSSGVQQWVARWNGPGSNADEPIALALDQSGNVYVTGYSINSNVTEYATVKYNSSGVQQWVSIYNGTGNTTSIANGITVDNLGYPYVTGRSNQTGTNYDIVTIKYNPSTGDSLWVKKYNGQSNYPDFGYGITADKFNNIYVAGATNDLVNQTWGIVDIKYSSSGVQQWASYYIPPGRQSSYATKIAVDSIGNTYLGGYSFVSAFSLHTEDYLAAKFDSNGVRQWINFYNGTGNDRDEGYGIAIDNSGNSFITGLSYAGYISGTCDYATVKYNPVGVQQWVARYNNPVNSNDYISAMKIDNAGNIYVAGTSDGQATGPDIVLIKFTPAGDTTWVSRYNGPTNSVDNATCLDIDSSGNIYVGGVSWSPSFQYDRYVTQKYNSSGSLQWSSTLDEGGYANIVNSIAVDASGNVYVVGLSGSSIMGHYFLVKYNSNGDTLWTRSAGNTNTGNLAKKVLVDRSGYVYITGKNSNDIYSLKFNPAGDTIWSARYNGLGSNTDEPNDMFVDNNGNVYVTGYSRQSTTFGSEDYVTIKYNSAGAQQWAKLYNGPGNFYDAARSIYVDTASNVYITGVSYGSGSNYDYATIKYDSLGDTVWTKRFNGPSNNIDIGTNVKVDLSGNTVVGGCTVSSSSYNLGILKYNPAGVQQWFTQYNTTIDSSNCSCLIALDNTGNVYVGSTTFENGTDYDILLAKYSDLIGIKKINNQIPGSFALNQNYPNPFNPATIIKYAIPKNVNVIIKIYDILGREVKTLVNEFQKAGYYEISFDGSNLSSGVYFYKIQAGDYKDVKKLVLLK
jgi:uncharacterized delta-60 repeat protein